MNSTHTAYLLATFLGSLLAGTALAAPQLSLSNKDLILELDLSIDQPVCRLTDRNNQEAWTAVDFGLIRAYDRTEDRVRTLLITPEAPNARCRIDIEKTAENRAVVRVDTGGGSTSAMGTMSFGVAFDVILELKGKTFEYTIPIDSLREQQLEGDLPQRWRLMSIELFPHLGATPAGVPGYIVIPSWSGAVYYFDRNHPRSNGAYSQPGYGDLGTEAGVNARWNFKPEAPAEYGSMVYGIQAVWEDQLQMPVYGTIRETAGLAGIILSGAYDTELRARRHQGPGDTTSINPIFHYRKFWHSKLDPVDRKVRLVTLGPDEASYAGIATTYRDYLVEEKGVKTLRERAGTNPEVAYFMDSIYIRMMMGMKESSMDGQGKMHSYQSFDDVAEVVGYLQDAGFEKVNLILVGANFEGHDGAHPTVFPIEKAHGGIEGLKRLIKAVNEADYRMCFHLNYKDVYTCSPDWTPEAIQINECGELRFHGAWIGGYSYQGIPQEMLERFGKRDLPKLRELGLRGMHYWDACLSVMEETFPPNRVITRREYGEGAMAYFKYAAEIFGTVGCETTISPLLGIIVNAGNTSYPFGGEPGKFKANGYCEAALLDHWVPMQHIVYHGLCCYGGGPEVGGRTGSEYSRKATREQIAQLRERYLQHEKWCGDLQYQFITDHRRIDRKVDRTTFSDGTRIWVNKSNQNVTLDDGTTIEPRGFVIKRADG